MEKTGNDRLAELKFARDRLTRKKGKDFEKTASIEEKKELEQVEAEIARLEAE